MSRDGEDSSAAGASVDALRAALGEPAPVSSKPNAADSQGRSSATYASSRPHAIPPTRAPSDDRNAPAVIIQTDDTVPTGPPAQMTMPMGAAPPFRRPGAYPHSFASQSGIATVSENVKATLQMPGRPRFPRTPTIVVRRRGPTKLQKLLVFLAMLFVFVSGGVVALIYGKSLGLSVELRPAPAKKTTPHR